MNFIVENWIQISFLLVAIGYIIKIILDSNFKKKEIRCNLFLQNRIKAIEQFLLNYSSLETSYTDVFYIYLQKVISAKETDDIILPLRYKVADSLSTLQLYTSPIEFSKFNEVYSNFMSLMNKATQLKHEVGMSEVERCNELSEFLKNNKKKNKIITAEIIESIQKGFQ